MLMFFLGTQVFAQNGYTYKVYNEDRQQCEDQNNITRQNILDNTYNVLRWAEYYNNKEGAKILINLSSGSLGDVNETKVGAAWQRAIDTWNGSVENTNEYPLHVTSASAAVDVEVSGFALDFENPGSNAGSAKLAYEETFGDYTIIKNAIDPLTDHPQYSETIILYNNTIEFTGEHTWVDDANAKIDPDPNDPYDKPQIDVETIALHEFGHLLGLRHTSSSNAIMFGDYRGGRRVLTNEDKEAFGNLYLLDWVVPIAGTGVIIDFNPDEVYNGSSIYSEASLFDEDGTGWVMGWEWELQLLHEAGTHVLAYNHNENGDGSLYIIGELLRQCGWGVTVPSLPTGFNWLLNNDGNIIADIWVKAYANTGQYEDTKTIAYNIPPSPPQISVGTVDYYQVQLTMNRNSIDTEKYKIYRKESGGNYSLEATINCSGETTTWIDNDINASMQARTYYYKVKAVDNSNLISGYSNEVNIDAMPNWDLKDDLVEYSAIPSEYDLSVYPNPFNPTTNLKVSVPKEGQANISIYNVLGKKVFEVRDFLNIGHHNFRFDATSLTTGIYLYNLSINGFSKTGKIMLVK